MFGFFVSTGTAFPEPNPGIFLFSTEKDAYEFAVSLLIEAGELCRGEDGLLKATDFPHNRFSSNAEAIEWCQDSLGASEYFHVYSVVDKREATQIAVVPPPPAE